MKLISAPVSIFSARVRAVFYAKNISFEIEPPPPDIHSAAYLAVNPIGKLPVLILDDGQALPESEVIIEYLEDRFPEPPLRPATHEGRARARLVSRVTDLYLVPPLAALFKNLDAVQTNLSLRISLKKALDDNLRLTERFIDEDGFSVGNHLTTADCALFPALLLIRRLWKSIADEDVLGQHQRFRDFCILCGRNPVLHRIEIEFEQG
jgi:glutathione S-transferase